MADETKPTVSSEEIKSLRTVFIGSNLIFWIVAVAMILYLQKINEKLEKLNTAVTSLQVATSNTNLESFQLVEGDWSQHYMKPDQGEPVVKYSFRRVEQQMPDDGMMPGPDGAMPVVPPAPVAPAPMPE